MQAFWGLAPFATEWRKGAFCYNAATTGLQEHGVTNRLRFVSVRGEARFPPQSNHQFQGLFLVVV